MGHEGTGSLLSELKQRGWCNSLMAGPGNVARGFGFFDVTVDLTQDGLQHVDDIVLCVFQYLRLLRATPPQRWIFDECRHLADMQFRFKDKEKPIKLVSDVVHSMQLYPLPEVLSAPYLVSEWRPELIEQLLATLVAGECRVRVAAQSLDAACVLTERWYGTKYLVEPIAAAQLADWSACVANEALQLPAPNPFIPSDFALLPLEADAAAAAAATATAEPATSGGCHPQMLVDTPTMRVWHKQDAEFLKPKTVLFVDFASPLAYMDPLNCNLTHMFVKLVCDQLNEYLYDAELAGLNMSLDNTASGLSVSGVMGGRGVRQSRNNLQ